MTNEIEVVTKQDILGKEFIMYGTLEEPLFLALEMLMKMKK